MISVLLPYRDAEATIREAAASVLADMAEGDELLAIDDGSSDASPRIVRALADARVVHLETRGAGIAVALARGAGLARGELLARMDADDVSLPGRLAAERARLESDPALGAVGVRVELFGEATAGMQSYVAWQNAAVTAADHAREIYVESPLCHPSTMIRRTALVAAGGFVDTPWPEDWDLWLRMHRAGFGLAKIPEVLFRWRRSARAVTYVDPRCAPERLTEARARYLADELDGGPFAIWGAGDTGKRLARALESHGRRPAFFVDIDPNKTRARDLPVLAAEEGMTRARHGGVFVVVAVGAPGARDIVRGRLSAAGFAEGAAFLCAA